MDPGIIFGVALLGLALVGVGVALVAAHFNSQLKWKQTSTWHVRYHANEGFNPAQLDSAITLAIAKLRPVWPTTVTTLIAVNTKFIVNVVPEWTDIWGRRVAGESLGDTVTVGSDLAALCHELAHRCEWELDKKTDDSHASWGSRGIFAAVDAYAAELKGVL